MKLKLILIILVLFCNICHAKQKIVHSVWIWQESGDCLWNLAKKYYGDPYKWKLIYNANKDRISNPNKIFPKQKLIIPAIDGTTEK